MKKKFFYILLAICMAVVGPAPVHAIENQGILSTNLSGESLPDVITETISEENELRNSQESFAGQEIPTVTVTDIDSMTSEVKSFMIQRVPTFVTKMPVEVSLDTMQDELNAIMQDIKQNVREDAMAHTGIPNEGDYLRYQTGRSQLQGGTQDIEWADNSYTRVRCNICITWTFDYYSTAEEEQAVTEKIGEIMEQLSLDGKSNYEKVKAIHDFICQNVTYDYTNLGNESYSTQYTAYGALINGTSVCQGYANLFYRMCLEAGIDTRIMKGSDGSDLHVWNIVKMGDKYYHVDVTWDDPLHPTNPDYFDWDYFLVGNSTITKDHIIDSSYHTEDFYTSYPISDTDYENIVEEEPSFAKTSLLLGGQIGVNFFMQLPEIFGCDYTNSYMEFLVNGKRETSSFDANAKSQDGQLYRFTCHINSVQMADPIHALFHYTVDGIEKIKEFNGYTVENYIEVLQNHTEISQEAKALAKALADYGHYMQLYLSVVNGWSLNGENATHTPMSLWYTNEYSEEQVQNIAETIDTRFLITQQSQDIKSISCSLQLDSDISLKVFLTPSDNYTGTCTATVNGNEPVSLNLVKGRYPIVISGIWAHRISEPYTIGVSTESGTTEVYLSALDYIGLCLQSSTNQTEKNAMVALYQYMQSAQNYQRSLPLPS